MVREISGVTRTEVLRAIRNRYRDAPSAQTRIAHSTRR